MLKSDGKHLLKISEGVFFVKERFHSYYLAK